MMHARRIDPETGEVERLPAHGTMRRREPSSAPVRAWHYDWYPLAVWSGRERLAQVMLEDAGLVTFCPRDTKWRNSNRYDRARRQKRRISYPQRPGLVFVGLPRPHPWHIVMGVHVVSHIISPTRARPVRMDTAQLWQWMEACEAGRFVAPDHERWMETGREFSAGDEVLVIGGPLEGQRLEVHAISDGMARLFVRMLGAERGFDVDVASLVKVD